MSYHVELRASGNMLAWSPQAADSYSVGTFAGRTEDMDRPERMVQITIGGQFACLTMVQLAQLRMVLDYAADHSLADWPGAS